MDEGLHPVLEERTLPEGEYLYLVNYYGQLTDDKIRKYKKIYGNIIVDHTHAFFQKPLPGVDTLYSCRKFLGVSDGAYLSTDAELEPEKKPLDHSMGRMEHILGRYEYDAGTFYQKMLDNAANYHGRIKSINACYRTKNEQCPRFLSLSCYKEICNSCQ